MKWSKLTKGTIDTGEGCCSPEFFDSWDKQPHEVMGSVPAPQVTRDSCGASAFQWTVQRGGGNAGSGCSVCQTHAMTPASSAACRARSALDWSAAM